MSRPRQRILGPDDSRNPVQRGSHGLKAPEIALMKSDGCHLCRRRDRALQIDHDHRHHPGKLGCRFCVRGAVCGPCNLVLRYLADSPETAERIGPYLRRFTA